jgi:cell division protein FtsW (lipid II flippase)
VYWLKYYLAKRNIRYVYAYAVLVLMVFAVFYPVLSGRPVRVDFVTEFLRSTKHTRPVG